MATVTVNDDGTITVSVNAQEQTFLAMAKEEGGIAARIEQRLNSYLDREIRDTFEQRFARLPAQDQADVLTKFENARPQGR